MIQTAPKRRREFAPEDIAGWLPAARLCGQARVELSLQVAAEARHRVPSGALTEAVFRRTQTGVGYG
jgi:hypothetical protein